MIRNILQVPDPLLRVVCDPVPIPFATEHKLVMADLVDTRQRHRAYGLAAPQIGSTWRIIAVDPKHTIPFLVLVNPVVLDSSGMASGREGCMSIDNGKTFMNVVRPSHIRVKFYDRAGHEHIMNVAGMTARVIQHEIDHLDGKLIGDAPLAVAQP